MRTFLFILIGALTLTLPSACANSHKRNDKNVIPHNEIRELKSVIKAARSYEHDRWAQIDSIRQRFLSASDRDSAFHLALSLSEENRNLNTDSSIYYSNIAAMIARDGSPKMQQQSDIARVSALATAGLFTQAYPIFEKLNNQGVDPSLRNDLWLTGRTLFSYLRSYVDDQKEYYDIYNARYLAFDDSLLRYLPASSRMRQFLECERLVTDGQIDEARVKLENLLSRVADNDNLYGMAAFQMAEVWKSKGDELMYATYLTKAAISDVKGCVREGIALPTLADWLYAHNEFSDAFLFINFSLEDAMKGHARMRTVSIAKLVPLIDGTYREKMNSSRDEMMIYFLLASCLFIISVVLLVVLFRSIRKMKENETKLNSLSKLQDSYIANFVGLCANYSDRLDTLSQTVSRKLSSGQADDLLRLVNSGKFTDNGNEKFFATFDAAFIAIYPDFIEGINRLLRPDQQIAIKEKNTLTPELRIYAFVRLGVEESTRIAQILHYSVSTVYAYRNRMRNRAISRDTFDNDVLNILK